MPEIAPPGSRGTPEAARALLAFERNREARGLRTSPLDWRLLLAIYAGRDDGAPATLAEAAAAAGAGAQEAALWLHRFEAAGLILREADGPDGTGDRLRLNQEASETLALWTDAISRVV
jgi:DNA-binding MarR family transcriptional regulator